MDINKWIYFLWFLVNCPAKMTRGEHNKQTTWICPLSIAIGDTSNWYVIESSIVHWKYVGNLFGYITNDMRWYWSKHGANPTRKCTFHWSSRKKMTLDKTWDLSVSHVQPTSHSVPSVASKSSMTKDMASFRLPSALRLGSRRWFGPVRRTQRVSAHVSHMGVS